MKEKSITKRNLVIVLVSASVCLFVGCFSDQPVPKECNNNVTIIIINNGGSTDPGSRDNDGGDTEFILNLDTGDEDFILDGDYSDFAQGEDSWAPGEVTSLLTKDHPGWQNARCFECHGVGTPWEPENHDPRMQYWSWSCSRGFPGSVCHGHNPNGADWFNHDGDETFFGCTQAGCHDTFDTTKEFENHGFTDAPDEFCNACHDFYWEGWPTQAK